MTKGIGLYRVRDVRAILSERLGIPVTMDTWKNYRDLGLVLPPVADHKARYAAYITEDQIDEIMARIARYRKSRKAKNGKALFRRPGQWRRKELRLMLSERTGWQFSIQNFQQLMDTGILPEPDVRRRRADNGHTSLEWAWSDAAAEDAVACVLAHVKPAPGGGFVYRRPGEWCSSELIEELCLRTGHTVTMSLLNELREQALAPEPDIRRKNLKTGELGTDWVWSDAAVEEAVAAFSAYFDQNPSAVSVEDSPASSASET